MTENYGVLTLVEFEKLFLLFQGKKKSVVSISTEDLGIFAKHHLMGFF